MLVSYSSPESSPSPEPQAQQDVPMVDANVLQLEEPVEEEEHSGWAGIGGTVNEEEFDDDGVVPSTYP